MSQRNMMFISLLVLFLALTTIHAQNECSGGSANCISIRNCPQIISILTDSRPPSAQMLQTFKNLQCGFENNDPKYCCNQITTTTTTTVKSEIETPHPPDVTNHPNLRLLNHQACGPVPQHRAIGGNETEVFQYPWVTLIAYDTGKPDPEYRCSGTIISSRYVLTAALCFNIAPHYRVISVRVGDHDLSEERDCITDNKGLEIECAEKYQDLGVDSIHPHPGYTNYGYKLYNNIGLIRLNVSIDFGPKNVKPICLPFGTAATLNHKRAIITKWWKHGKLLQAKLSLMTIERCMKIYKEGNTSVFNYIIPDATYKLLCAGGQENENTCLGDRGGPLIATGIYNGRSAHIIQYGVYNYNTKCLRRNIPGVYTKVSYFMDWILDTMTD